MAFLPDPIGNHSVQSSSWQGYKFIFCFTISPKSVQNAFKTATSIQCRDTCVASVRSCALFPTPSACFSSPTLLEHKSLDPSLLRSFSQKSHSLSIKCTPQTRTPDRKCSNHLPFDLRRKRMGQRYVSLGLFDARTLTGKLTSTQVYFSTAGKLSP